MTELKKQKMMQHYTHWLNSTSNHSYKDYCNEMIKRLKNDISLASYRGPKNEKKREKNAGNRRPVYIGSLDVEVQTMAEAAKRLKISTQHASKMLNGHAKNKYQLKRILN